MIVDDDKSESNGSKVDQIVRQASESENLIAEEQQEKGSDDAARKPPQRNTGTVVCRNF